MGMIFLDLKTLMAFSREAQSVGRGTLCCLNRVSLQNRPSP